MEQQQLHQTQLLQNILEVLHSTDESVDLPADLGLPLKNIGEVKEMTYIVNWYKNLTVTILLFSSENSSILL